MDTILPSEGSGTGPIPVEGKKSISERISEYCQIKMTVLTLQKRLFWVKKMIFAKFADLMEKIGYQGDESIAPFFILNKKDLKNPVFKHTYFKEPGLYRVTSMWAQGEHVAIWARMAGNETKLFPFHKDEVDFLVAQNKFRKQ